MKKFDSSNTTLSLCLVVETYAMLHMTNLLSIDVVLVNFQTNVERLRCTEVYTDDWVIGRALVL